MTYPSDDEVTRLQAEADQRQMDERDAIEKATKASLEAIAKELDGK